MILEDYVFVVPRDKNSEAYLFKRYKSYKQSSDGNPYCTIKEGYLMPTMVYETIPTVDGIDIRLNVYTILGYEDKDEFVTEFWDGNVVDDNFEPYDE